MPNVKTEIDDNIFGKLTYNIYWKRDYPVTFMGNEINITLVIDGDEDADFEESQYKAFKQFEDTKADTIHKVEMALLEHYQTECTENRVRFGEQADELSPRVNKLSELNNQLNLKQIIVMETFDETEKHIGFVFDATWEPELGIGVKIQNGDVFEVGNQDITL